MLNLNINTVGPAMVLINMGFPLKEIGSLFNHPAAKDYIKAFEDWLRSIKKQDVATTQDYDIYEKDSKYLNTRNIPKLTNVFRHNGKIYFSFIGSEDRIYHLVEFAE